MVFLSVPEDINALIHRFLEGIGIGLVLSGYLVCSAVIGGSTHLAQTGCEIHSLPKGKGLEGNKPLIVVGGNDGIKLLIGL